MMGRSPEILPTVGTPYLYSLAEVGRMLGDISERQVYRLIESGQLRSVKIGRRRVVRDVDLRAFVDDLGSDGAA